MTTELMRPFTISEREKVLPLLIYLIRRLLRSIDSFSSIPRQSRDRVLLSIQPSRRFLSLSGAEWETRGVETLSLFSRSCASDCIGFVLLEWSVFFARGVLYSYAYIYSRRRTRRRV